MSFVSTHKVCIAPMMQYTDMHDRYLLRLISKRVFLVKTIKEMRLALVKINQRNKLKAKNEEFIKKFYLTKTEILQYK